MLTQNDLVPPTAAAAAARPPHRLPPLEVQATNSNLPQYPVTVDIPMQEIRRQNDVERWRNNLRLQEKFEVSLVESFSAESTSIVLLLRLPATLC